MYECTYNYYLTRPHGTIGNFIISVVPYIKLKNMKHLQVATESIAFQSKVFFTELTSIVTDMRADGLVESRENYKNLMECLSRCIFKNTGIMSDPYVFDAGSYENAFVMVPTLSPSNVLNSGRLELFNWALNNGLKSKTQNYEGMVDTKNARVSGDLSKINHRMGFSLAYIRKNNELSDSEVAAIILHEVGHAFTYLQYLTDQMMALHTVTTAWQEITSGAHGTTEIVLKRAAKELGISDTGWIKETAGKNADISVTLLCSAAVRVDASTDNKRFYTMDTAEELADIFAVRHGAAREVIKIRSYYGNPQPRYNIRSNLLFSTVMLALTTAAVGAAVPLIGMFTFVIAISAGMHFLKENKSAAQAPSWTTVAQKLSKVRNQVVEQIKLCDLDPKEFKETLATIELADRLIKDEGVFEKPVAEAFYDYFRSGKKSAEALREYTDRLETLISNDLFVAAARLGNLAKS